MLALSFEIAISRLEAASDKNDMAVKGAATEPFAKAGETCFTDTVKTISIRDLRLRWPAAESALAIERELIVTRDGKPVAKLVRFEDKTRKRRRFKAEEHKIRMQKMWERPGFLWSKTW